MLKQKYIQTREVVSSGEPRQEFLVILPKAGQVLGKSRTVGVRQTLDEAVALRNEVLGYDPDIAPVCLSVPTMPDLTGAVKVIGCVGDTHLGDTMERLDVLNSLYAHFNEHGVKVVLHTGNMVTGESDKFRAQIKVWGVEGQADYVIKNWPRYPGITTYFVDGDDHEGNWWQKDGIHFGSLLEQRAIAAGRNDLRWLGYVEGNITLLVGDHPVRVRISHPGKGSAYALSHMGQRLVDVCEPDRLPDLWLIGHFHKASFLPDYKGVALLQTGCTVDVGAWAHKQPLVYHIGGWLVTVRTDNAGNITYAPWYLRYPTAEWATPGVAPLIVEA